jgi:hypothetical protein
MSELLPIPTPKDIEAALAERREGISTYGWFAWLDDHVDHSDKPWPWTSDELSAEADRLWWVTMTDPEGVENPAYGGGVTSAEAAAVAWCNACLVDWVSKPGLSEEDDAVVPRDVPEDAIVPRHVPEGYRFKVRAKPVDPTLKVVQGSQDLLKSDKAIPSLKSALLAERKKSASDEEFLEHLYGLLQEIIPNFSATLTYEE